MVEAGMQLRTSSSSVPYSNGDGNIPSTFLLSLKLWLHACWILLCMLITFVFLVPVALYRWIVTKTCQLVRPDLSHILSLQGSLYINKDVQSEIWSNITLRFKLRGPLQFESTKYKLYQQLVLAKNGIQDGQLCFPELQQYCVKWGGYFFWKWESAFNIDEHVTLYNPKSQGQRLSITEMDELEERYLKTPFKLDKSPWQILVVENNAGYEEPWALVLFKFHHSLSDGIGIFNTLMKCVDEQVPSPSIRVKPSPPTKFQFLTFPFAASFELAKLAQCKSIKSPWDVSSVDQSAGKITKRFMTRSKYLEVAGVKTIAARHDVSFFAVILAAATGGIRKFLLTKMEDCQLPKYILSDSPFPVDSRDDGLTNSICVASFNLPVSCPTIKGRLQLCNERVNDRRKSIEPRMTNFFFNLDGCIPKGFPSFPCRFPNMSMSNFAGPILPVKFDGQELFEMSYAMLSPPHAFGMSILTYAGGLQFDCTGDHRIFSSHEEIDLITQSIEEEFQEMEMNMDILP